MLRLSNLIMPAVTLMVLVWCLNDVADAYSTWINPVRLELDDAMLDLARQREAFMPDFTRTVSDVARGRARLRAASRRLIDLAMAHHPTYLKNIDAAFR